MIHSWPKRRETADPPACLIPVGWSMALGVGLRFLFLGRKPLWEDEGWTLYVSGSARSLTDLAGLDPHPLSFYAFARVMDGFLILSEWTLRFPSAFASSLALVLWAVCLIRLDVPRVVARWCVLLFAVLPLNLAYAQEGRAYALAQLAGVLCLTAYALALKQHTRWRIAWLLAATAFSCHFDGFGLAVPFGLLLHSLGSMLARNGRRSIFVAVLLGGLLAAPYYVFRLGHMLGAGDMHSLTPVRRSAFALLAERFVSATPFGVTATAIERFVNPALALPVMAAAAAILIAAALVARRRSVPRDQVPLFAAISLPALLLFFGVCAVTGADTLEPRYFVTLAPGLIALMVIGGMRLLRRFPVAAYIVFLLVPAVVSTGWILRRTARLGTDWRSLHAAITSRVEPGDLFLHEAYRNYPLLTLTPLVAYARREGRPIADERCYEYRGAVEAPNAAIDLGEANDWPSAEERRELIAFLRRSPSGRVWALSGPLARHRELNLESAATCVGRWKASGLEAALWTVKPDGLGDSGIAPEAGAGRSDTSHP